MFKYILLNKLYSIKSKKTLNKNNIRLMTILYTWFEIRYTALLQKTYTITIFTVRLYYEFVTPSFSIPEFEAAIIVYEKKKSQDSYRRFDLNIVFRNAFAFDVIYYVFLRWLLRKVSQGQIIFSTTKKYRSRKDIIIIIIIKTKIIRREFLNFIKPFLTQFSWENYLCLNFILYFYIVNIIVSL